MIYMQFVLAGCLYFVLAFISYSTEAKQSPWYYFVGLTAALLVNLIWLNLSKATQNSSDLILKGLIWDSMLTAVYLITPLLLFNVQLTKFQGMGLMFVVIGLILTKI